MDKCCLSAKLHALTMAFSLLAVGNLIGLLYALLIVQDLYDCEFDEYVPSLVSPISAVLVIYILMTNVAIVWLTIPPQLCIYQMTIHDIAFMQNANIFSKG